MKLLDPKVDIGYIDIQMDRMPDDVKAAMESYGAVIPIMSLNNIVYLTNIDHFKYSTKLYSIPTVDVRITDLQNVYTNSLKNKEKDLEYDKYLNTGVVRFGYKDFAVKFNILSGNIRNQIDSYTRNISSTVWNYKWYQDNETKSFRNKTILEIIKQLCTECGLGLYVYENEGISKRYDHIIFHNMNYLQCIDYLIYNYTDNIWCVDGNYFLHIGDVDNIKNQDISLYTWDYKNHEKTTPKPFIFRTQSMSDEVNRSDSNTDNFIIVDWHIQSSLSKTFINSHAEYECYTEKGRISQVYDEQNKKFGIGKHSTNTYSGFKNHIYPYMADMLNKDISSNIIEFEVACVIPELNPFDIILLSIYKNETQELDTNNSGKKMVISYDVVYNREGDGLGHFSTLIRCI